MTLKDCRKLKQLSQNTAAKLIGVSRSYYNQIERGVLKGGKSFWALAEAKGLIPNGYSVWKIKEETNKHNE